MEQCRLMSAPVSSSRSFSYDGPDFDDFDFDDFFSKGAAPGAVQASDTDFGLNVKGGLEFGEGNLKPFGEAGFYLKDGGFLWLQGGVRFTLGGG